jgi:hypothetical protein
MESGWVLLCTATYGRDDDDDDDDNDDHVDHVDDGDNSKDDNVTTSSEF